MFEKKLATWPSQSWTNFQPLQKLLSAFALRRRLWPLASLLSLFASHCQDPWSLRLEKVFAFTRRASVDIIKSNKELRKILNKQIKDLEPTVKQYEGKLDGSYMPYRQARDEMSATKDKLLEIDAQDADLTKLLAGQGTSPSAT